MLSTCWLTGRSRLLARAALLLTVVACEPSTDGEDTGDSATEPSEYVVEGSDPLVLDLDTTEAAAAIDELFATVISYEGSSVFVAYNEVMAYADEACPGAALEESGGTQWNSECTSTLGASYSGFFSVFQGTNSQGQAEQAMRAESTISTPDGYELVVAGDVRTVVDEVANSWFSEVGGVVSYDGPASVGTWMEDSPDLNLSYTLLLNDDGGLVNGSFSGSVGSLTGAVSAVDLSDITVALVEDTPCPMEPSGKIYVRDANGAWAEIIFDVEEDDEGGFVVDEGECDGCGTLWFDGEDMGQVCVDVAPIFEAPMPPW